MEESYIADLEGDPKCVLPFVAMNVYPTGGVRQCVSGTRDLGNLRKGDSLSSVWTSDRFDELRAGICSSELPEVCRVCRERESLGLVSRRQILAADETVSSAEPLVRTGPLQVRFLDIALSNRCNMWCRTCNSDFSSSWEKYEAKLSPELRNSEQGENLNAGNGRSLQLSQILDILPYCSGLRRLTIKGGEPFVEPLVQELLQQLLERGFGQKIALTFVTNASVVNPSLLDVLRRFKTVVLSFSIDGSDRVHRYIRGDQFRLERLADNIRQFRTLPNLDERPILPTISVYNVLDLGNLYQWCVEELQTKPTFYQILVSPEVLNLKVFPLHFRARVRESLLALKGKIESHDSKNAQHIDRMLGMIETDNSYKDMEESRDKYFRQFVKYTQEVDQLRGQKVLEVIPEFSDLGVF